MNTFKEHWTGRFKAILVGLCLFPLCGWAQLSMIYIDPVHEAGELEYISTQKKLIKKISTSTVATSALYTSSAEDMRQLERIKKNQYQALTTSYAFYKDSIRIKRFNETQKQVKRNLEVGLAVIEANSQASYFFRDRMIELISELNDAERVFKQATVTAGKTNQMSNADRNLLLFKAEDMLADITKEGQRIVNVGKMITLDPERMEQLVRDRYEREYGSGSDE